MLNSFYDKFIFTNSLKYVHYNFFLLNTPFVVAPSAMLLGLSRIPDTEIQKQLYYAVKVSVIEQLLQQFHRDFGLQKEMLLEFFQAFFTASGWGLFENRDVNYVAKRAIVSVSNAPFAQFFSERPGKPIDFFLRAITAGVFCIVFEEDVDCVETQCSAMGEGSCTFVVKTLLDFDFSNREVREQLNP